VSARPSANGWLPRRRPPYVTDSMDQGGGTAASARELARRAAAALPPSSLRGDAGDDDDGKDGGLLEQQLDTISSLDQGTSETLNQAVAWYTEALQLTRWRGGADDDVGAAERARWHAARAEGRMQLGQFAAAMADCDVSLELATAAAASGEGGEATAGEAGAGGGGVVRARRRRAEAMAAACAQRTVQGAQAILAGASATLLANEELRQELEEVQ
jgi:hypothetical protein